MQFSTLSKSWGCQTTTSSPDLRSMRSPRSRSSRKTSTRHIIIFRELPSWSSTRESSWIINCSLKVWSFWWRERQRLVSSCSLKSSTAWNRSKSCRRRNQMRTKTLKTWSPRSLKLVCRATLRWWSRRTSRMLDPKTTRAQAMKRTTSTLCSTSTGLTATSFSKSTRRVSKTSPNQARSRNWTLVKIIIWYCARVWNRLNSKTSRTPSHSSPKQPRSKPKSAIRSFCEPWA